MMTDRETLVYRAKLSEEAEQFDEMLKDMKTLVLQATQDELTVEESNLLSVAAKNVVGARRASWHQVARIFDEELIIQAFGDANDSEKIAVIARYKIKLATEVTDICNDIISILDGRLIPNATLEETKVFYYKMKGDYYRYLSEVQDDDTYRESAGAAFQAYKEAADIALVSLAPTHPYRLGLALNLSVYYYEIINWPAKACQIAEEAFDDAMAELDLLDDEQAYRDSTLVMQLLRDNLVLWRNEQFEQRQDEEEEERESSSTFEHDRKTYNNNCDTMRIMQFLQDNLSLWNSDGDDYEGGDDYAREPPACE